MPHQVDVIVDAEYPEHAADLQERCLLLERRVAELEHTKEALVAANKRLSERRVTSAAGSPASACDEMMAILVEALPFPVLLKDFGGQFRGCNEPFASFFGATPGEIADTPLQALFPPEADQFERSSDEEALAKGKAQPYTLKVRNAVGELRDVVISKSLLRSRDGSLRAILAAMFDVTEENRIQEELRLQAYALEEEIANHQRAEEALRERERMLSLIINTVPQTIFWKDTRSVYLGCNDKFARSAGLPSSADIVGKTDFDLPWLPEETDAYRRDDRDVMLHDRAKVHIEETQSQADGRLLVVDTTKIPLHDGNGCVVGVLGVYEDISERKRVEQELRESEERLRVIFEASQVGIVLVSQEGKIDFANRRLAEMFGTELPEIIGTRYVDWLHPSSADAGALAMNLLLKGEVNTVTLERHYLRKDGGEFWGYLSGRRLEEEDGTLRALVGCIADVTEAKAIEEELFKARKLEALGILAGGIAHDFNNLLTGIMGNISLARLNIPQNQEALCYLDRAQKASERSREITQQLLTFAKGGAPVKKLTSVQQIITDSATFALMGSNVRCTFDIAQDLWPAEIDAAQMSRVISNLVINADQAMPEGGLLVIRAENVLSDEETEQKRIRITVKDTGVGISGEHRERIFDPYFTTKQSGSGLGLATVYSIIKSHDGELKVYSRPNHGTTFAITLPAQAEIVEEQQATTEEEEAGCGRILVMDDEECIRELALAVLEALGYEPTACSDGVEMLELYREAMEAKLPYHAVIMDLTVPGGMGGREAVGRLLELDPQAVAIASSGYSEDAVMAAHAAHGFAGVISKPYTLQELNRNLASILAQARKARRAG